LRDLRNSPAPVMVPPVPTAETKTSTLLPQSSSFDSGRFAMEPRVCGIGELVERNRTTHLRCN
jgi:hypothetical protein